MGLCNFLKNETFKESQKVFKKYFSLDLALVFIYYSVAFELKTTVCGGEGRLNKSVIRHLPELFNKRKSFWIWKKDDTETKLPLKT